MKRYYLLKILTIITVATAWPLLAAPLPYEPLLQLHSKDLPLNPYRTPPDRLSPQETAWPEYYIDPVVDHGLNLVLPAFLRSGLDLDTGYDRWQGLPTLRADFFQTVKAWPDKTLFMAPSLQLSSTQERLSLGAGFRQLLTDHTMVGIHGFHDWVRSRRSTQRYLKEAGVGLELSALPGRYSDLTLSANLYFPVNERSRLERGGAILVNESLLQGADAQLGFQLPAMVDFLDARVDAEAHHYRGYAADISGFNVGLSVNTRDGMLAATFRRGFENQTGDHFSVHGSINLTFDWLALSKGEMPFSAPYQAPEFRYERDLRQSLHTRATRKKDMPADRSAHRIRLAAVVWDDTVSFAGGFPALPNAWLTVQTSQSPWRDCTEVRTDSKGMYSGQLKLPPGTYKLRLVHKSSGTISNVKTIEIRE